MMVRRFSARRIEFTGGGPLPLIWLWKLEGCCGTTQDESEGRRRPLVRRDTIPR